MHEFGMCSQESSGTRIEVCEREFRGKGRIRTHASSPGPVRRDLNPGGKVSTAGLSDPVVKEARARDFVRFASMS